MVYEDNQDEWNPALDQEMAAAMLKNYCEHVPAKFLPDFYETIKTEFGNDYEKYTKFVYSHSKLLKKGQKFYQNEKTLKDQLEQRCDFYIFVELFSAIRKF